MIDPLEILDDEYAVLRSELAAASDQVVHLEAALHSNRQIGIALGIIVERYKVTPETAFDVLTRLSQDRNEKARVVAERIIETGQMPGTQDPRLLRRLIQRESGPAT